MFILRHIEVRHGIHLGMAYRFGLEKAYEAGPGHDAWVIIDMECVSVFGPLGGSQPVLLACADDTQ